MPVETMLAYALGLNGALLGLLIALIVHVFLSLKNDVKSVATEVAALSTGRAKLMHRSDCRSTTDRLHERLDEHADHISTIDRRLSVIEAIGGGNP